MPKNNPLLIALQSAPDLFEPLKEKLVNLSFNSQELLDFKPESKQNHFLVALQQCPKEIKSLFDLVNNDNSLDLNQKAARLERLIKPAIPAMLKVINDDWNKGKCLLQNLKPPLTTMFFPNIVGSMNNSLFAQALRLEMQIKKFLVNLQSEIEATKSIAEQILWNSLYQTLDLAMNKLIESPRNPNNYAELKNTFEEIKINKTYASLLSTKPSLSNRFLLLFKRLGSLIHSFVSKKRDPAKLLIVPVKKGYIHKHLDLIGSNLELLIQRSSFPPKINNSLQQR